MLQGESLLQSFGHSRCSVIAQDSYEGKHRLLLQEGDSGRQMSWEEVWLLRPIKEPSYSEDSCALTIGSSY